ncbi:MAG: SDR family oxidoreductase [Flavobacteriaceae bacterium]|jgi:NAD(P)-dependent dehydrogenase (short-subunit alcohol dehydrogenase family)|nr:SDR family oxidoreductase [Flavobacteriaceae bacterium]MBT6704861.1 SDR family oxidoreductase [Flavobacteriaceae bacterium]MBT7242174.1 SDR family oxidoreductase [Flavobacteriaceae bacterium]|tara:strand:- start:519 stop:1214 length:696 start_codon:yes stop_codon:yes gene_type:complete
MNKNYVIIGGSSGIGKELVSILAREGHNVFATYNENKVKNNDKVQYQKFNVLNDSLNLDNLPDEIDGLVYCPGSINLKPFKRFTDEDFISDFKLQVVGATSVIKALIPRLATGENSSIVLFSTIAVQNGFNFHSQVSISKGAIEGLTRSLAAELAPKIRVNAVAPSITDTSLAGKFLNTPQKIAAQAEKNPLKKIGEVKDVAEAAAYLLTDKSSWTTGQILHVDGGSSTIK